MVIAAGRQERRLTTVALRDLEPEDAAIERDRPFEIRYFQVNVTDARTRNDCSKALITALSGLICLRHT
jgi:hypothetical protein